MKVGPKTLELLDNLQHPPTARDMQHICNALVRDGDVGRAKDLAQTMLDHFLQATGDHEFYYWLGARQIVLALADGEHDRWRRRSDAKFRRSLRKAAHA